MQRYYINEVSYEKRIKDHIGRFTKLYNQIKDDKIDENFVEYLEEYDCIFPDIDYNIYHKL